MFANDPVEALQLTLFTLYSDVTAIKNSAAINNRYLDLI